MQSKIVGEWIGWLSSAILVLTVAHQVWKQWRENTSKGVSPWLFAGQLAASIGFTVYSVTVDNWVFVATNSLMICNALAGYSIVLWHRRRKLPSSPRAQPQKNGLNPEARNAELEID